MRWSCNIEASLKILKDEFLLWQKEQESCFHDKGGGDNMSADEIVEKLKIIGAALILMIVCAARPVRADQQYVLTVGETMVIPCLLEIWSDQSVSCVISNPDVLMSDGSGRAVIALSEGTSDVYVHMTNPDTDIRYTFVVESAGLWEEPEERNMPEETTPGGGGSYGQPVSGTGGTDGREAVGRGNDIQGTVSPGSTADPQTEAPVSEDVHTDVPPQGTVSENVQTNSTSEAPMPEGVQTDLPSEASMPEGAQTDLPSETPMPEGAQTDLPSEAPMPEDDENSTPDKEETVPFWDERGSGGISFEVINDFSEAFEAEEGLGDNNVKYRPFAYLKGDGDIAPFFVCAAGREVRWKYVGRTLYIEASKAYSGPYRVSARDSRGNIYYFSS